MINAVGKVITILLLTYITIVTPIHANLQHGNHIISNTKYVKEKQKDYSSITSLAHTFFFKNQKNEEISLYFSTIEEDKENREKIFEITIYLYKAIINEGYKEILANHPVPPVSMVSIDIIQQPEGVVIVITKNGDSIWKLFIISLPEDIVNEIILKVSGVEI